MGAVAAASGGCARGSRGFWELQEEQVSLRGFRGAWYLGEQDTEGGGQGEEANDEPDGAGMAGDVHGWGRGMRLTLVVVGAVLAQQKSTQGTCTGTRHAGTL